MLHPNPLHDVIIVRMPHSEVNVLLLRHKIVENEVLLADRSHVEYSPYTTIASYSPHNQATSECWRERLPSKLMSETLLTLWSGVLSLGYTNLKLWAGEAWSALDSRSTDEVATRSACCSALMKDSVYTSAHYRSYLLQQRQLGTQDSTLLTSRRTAVVA